MTTKQSEFKLVIKLKENTYTSDIFNSMEATEEAMQDLKTSFGILDQDMMITYKMDRNYK